MAATKALICKGCWQNMHLPIALRGVLSVHEMGGVLDIFYDECAAAIWQHDGLLNKTIGDAVMAVFNFPIKQGDHARQALLAAREIQQRLDARKKEAGLEFGVGICLQCGEVSFG